MQKFSKEISGTSFKFQIKLTPNNMRIVKENLYKVFSRLAFSRTIMYLFSPKGTIKGYKSPLESKQKSRFFCLISFLTINIY